LRPMAAHMADGMHWGVPYHAALDFAKEAHNEASLVVHRTAARAVAVAMAAACGLAEPKRTAASEEYFPAWAELLDACREYCRLSGWRFMPLDFDLRRPVPSPEALAARVRALPMVLRYAERCRSAGQEGPLLSEFRQSQRLLARDAAYQMMKKTCVALGVSRDPREASVRAQALVEEWDCAYEDATVPLPIIASRLQNHEARQNAGQDAEAPMLLHATFIVDFAEAQGELKELRDSQTARWKCVPFARSPCEPAGGVRRRCSRNWTSFGCGWRSGVGTTKPRVLLLPRSLPSRRPRVRGCSHSRQPWRRRRQRRRRRRR